MHICFNTQIAWHILLTNSLKLFSIILRVISLNNKIEYLNFGMIFKYAIFYEFHIFFNIHFPLFIYKQSVCSIHDYK